MPTVRAAGGAPPPLPTDAGPAAPLSSGRATWRGLEARTLFCATDISPAALARAEAGVHPLDRIPLRTESHRLSGGRSSRSDHDTAAYGRAAMDRTLRQRVVFSDHGLASDEAFAGLHLVSCRNVLIHFDRALQDRALRLFRDSLVHGGFLGLGAQETARFSRLADAFEEFAPAERICRRRAGHAPGPPGWLSRSSSSWWTTGRRTSTRWRPCCGGRWAVCR